MADSKEPKIEVKFYEPVMDRYEVKETMADIDGAELDDPYLELFDRINQLEMDIKELSAKFDKYIDVTLQQRAYNTWVLQGMPVGGAAMVDGGAKNINSQQSEFKFFEEQY